MDTFRNLSGTLANSMDEINHYTRELAGNAVEEVFGEEIDEKSKDKDGKVNETKAKALREAYTTKLAADQKKKEDSINMKLVKAQEATSKIKDTGDIKKFLKDDSSGYRNEAVKNVLGEDFNADSKGVENDKQLALTYAAMLTGQDKDTFTYKAGKGVGTVKDAEGNEIVSGVSDEVMRREIAKRVAAEEIRL
jgi:hypothetical protein